MSISDMIVVMKDGLVQQVDTPQNLYDYPVNLFVAGFIGSPQMNFFKVKIEKNNENFIARLGDYKIPINWSTDKSKNLSNYDGKEVLMGIRPEELHDEQSTQAKETLSFVNALVELSEPMGSEVYLYLDINNEKAIAKIPPRTNAKIGDVVSLGINTTNVHLFDIETENAIAVR